MGLEIAKVIVAAFHSQVELGPLTPIGKPRSTLYPAMSMAKVTRKKNLLLCFDAFGTLFTPSVPVPKAYAAAALRHGIKCGDVDSPEAITSVTAQFKPSFKHESARNPNYGKATGLGAEKWWSNVRLCLRI